MVCTYEHSSVHQHVRPEVCVQGCDIYSPEIYITYPKTQLKGSVSWYYIRTSAQYNTI